VEGVWLRWQAGTRKAVNKPNSMAGRNGVTKKMAYLVYRTITPPLSRDHNRYINVYESQRSPPPRYISRGAAPQEHRYFSRDHDFHWRECRLTVCAAQSDWLLSAKLTSGLPFPSPVILNHFQIDKLCFSSSSSSPHL